MSIIIVGSVIAGYSLAREYRKLYTDSIVTIHTADDGANIYKPNLSKAFAMQKTPAAVPSSIAGVPAWKVV